MNRGFRPLCTYRLNWVREPHDGEINEMTLPSRHIIRKSSLGFGCLRSSTLPLGHGGSNDIESLRVSGEETFCFLEA